MKGLYNAPFDVQYYLPVLMFDLSVLAPTRQKSDTNALTTKRIYCVQLPFSMPHDHPERHAGTRYYSHRPYSASQSKKLETCKLLQSDEGLVDIRSLQGLDLGLDRNGSTHVTALPIEMWPVLAGLCPKTRLMALLMT